MKYTENAKTDVFVCIQMLKLLDTMPLQSQDDMLRKAISLLYNGGYSKKSNEPLYRIQKNCESIIREIRIWTCKH